MRTVLLHSITRTYEERKRKDSRLNTVQHLATYYYLYIYTHTYSYSLASSYYTPFLSISRSVGIMYVTVAVCLTGSNFFHSIHCCILVHIELYAMARTIEQQQQQVVVVLNKKKKSNNNNSNNTKEQQQ